MYVRDARNREEVWLLDHIEEMGLDDAAFRSRDYVIAIDEDSDEKAGFGRVRVHKREDHADTCELTGIGVLEGWRGQGVGAHVLERLVQTAGDADFEDVYSLTPEPDYLSQFGFEPASESELPAPLDERLAELREHHDDPVVPMAVGVAAFEVPERLREGFKRASARGDPSAGEPDATPEDFGIDSETATYTYDTGG
jgi:N-acetylglutamate synthase-like GNAT family acetyltransferase